MKKRRLLLRLLVGIVLIGWILWANWMPQLTSVSLSLPDLPGGFSGFRIAQVSDLHNATLGKDNRWPLALLQEAKPDIIAITGDLVDSRKPDTQVALAFLREAMKIAPCFYVNGNHEASIPDYEALTRAMEELGVQVLENRGVTLELGGDKIRLLGIDDPYFANDGRYGDKESVTAERIGSLTATYPGFSVLLSHRPELFEVYVEQGVDLALSGHAHGGQFRLPFVGGLYAPGQGFFPKYDAGVFEKDNTQMVVSRGLGNSSFPLRLFNRPEIVLITLGQ